MMKMHLDYNLLYYKGYDCSKEIQTSFIKQDFLKTPVNGAYQSELARAALKQIIAPEKSIDQTHYGLLKEYPSLRVSFSHTQFNQVVMAICAVCDLLIYPQVKSIGIDIEHKQRVIKPGIEKYFMSKEEKENPEWNPMELWVLKEAIFKALNTGVELNTPAKHLLKSIHMDDLSARNIQAGLYHLGEYLVALAIIYQ